MTQIVLPQSSLELMGKGSGREFVDKLIAEIHLHPALNHPYLSSLSEGKFRNMDEVIRDYAHQYSFYSLWFTRYLSGVIKSLPEESYKIALYENLQEENGNPNSDVIAEMPHVEIFKLFKKQIGINQEYMDNHPASTTSTLWRDLFLQKCNSEIVGVGLGAIGLATEFIVPKIYKHLAVAIDEHSTFHDDASLFFRLHIECDKHHADNLLDITSKIADTLNNREAIRFGVFSALNLRNAFWDSQYSRALSLDYVNI